MRQARGGRVMHAPPQTDRVEKKKKRTPSPPSAPLLFFILPFADDPAHPNPHSHTPPTHTSWATPHPARPPRPSRSRWRRRRCVMWVGSDGERKRERARRPAAWHACVCPPSPSRQGDGARPLARPSRPRVGWAGRLGCLARPVDRVPGRGSPATCPSVGLPLPPTRRPIAPPPCRSLLFYLTPTARSLSLSLPPGCRRGGGCRRRCRPGDCGACGAERGGRRERGKRRASAPPAAEPHPPKPAPPLSPPSPVRSAPPRTIPASPPPTRPATATPTTTCTTSA